MTITNTKGAQVPFLNPRIMIQEYINYLFTLKGYSLNTLKAYEKDLKDFVSWMHKNREGARWSTITREDIDAYVSDLVNIGLAPSTTNRRLAAISGIYSYFKREGLEVTNPVQFESRRKRPQAVPNTIPYKELEQAYNNSHGVVKVMLGLLITTGIRIQELLDIEWQDINFETSSIKIHGKGNKERLVYTNAAQLDTLRELYNMNKPCGLIFNQTQRMARHMIWNALKPFSHAAQLSPHAIRHTFATNMAANGVNTSTLAIMLGHKNLDTTQQYIDFGQTSTQQACLAYSLLH